ncbi:Asp-tRNA(Asn)/Glu-tRNA(Gln) amidotransferase subunit GatC [Ruminococcus sp.]|uniref:Asp-tRNA(Asn)/Glu-tRNA(Gln) amidotransferase subunit GatC n=1 Tax=Ruminococcus sp. TaxID=41978 RepID=UPI0025E30521|nr:Asp-tRNA(Asn)/Glu-tRNA(Gln) amidotransferase subunit GatC [Ruminococcus sp.]
MDLQMIAYLAELGKLSFTPEEMEKMAAEMTSIIETMDTVKEIDVGYDALADNKDIYLNDLREDVKADSFPTEKILQNAVNDENYFVVPKVVE